MRRAIPHYRVEPFSLDYIKATSDVGVLLAYTTGMVKRTLSAILLSLSLAMPISGCSALLGAETAAEQAVDVMNDAVMAMRVLDDLTGGYVERKAPLSADDIAVAADAIINLKAAEVNLRLARDQFLNSEYEKAARSLSDALGHLEAVSKALQSVGVDTSSADKYLVRAAKLVKVISG